MLVKARKPGLLRAALRFTTDTIRFTGDIFAKRELITQLAKREFKGRFVGSTLGLFWAFLEPMMLSLIFWFVWGSGLRGSSAVNGAPFVAYLLPAMFAWQFFAEVLQSGTRLMKGYGYLVNRPGFRLSILPIVRILSSFALHAIFMVIVIAILQFYGYFPALYWLQLPYYMLGTCMLLLGLTWLTASTNVFAQDIGHIVTIFVRFGFFLTPIIWQIDRLPEQYHPIIKLNPMYYIVQGYRETLVYGRWFWESPGETMYFWGFTALFLLVGISVFTRLKPHFADVL